MNNNGALISYSLSAIVLAVLGWACLSIGSSPQFNVLILLSGGIIGWILGILISPNSPKEELKFSEFGKAIGAFLTGFLAAKIERIFELVIQKPSDVSDIFVGRSLVFVVSFGLGILFTFIWRTYIAPNSSQD
jgi:hypothetical protein